MVRRAFITVLGILLAVSITADASHSRRLGPGGASDVILQPAPGPNDGTDNGSAAAGKDTITQRGQPTTNYGSWDMIWGMPRSNCNPADGMAFIQFDLTGLPAAGEVAHAYVGVTQPAHTGCFSNCTADFYFYPIEGPWAENTVTHNTAPPISATPAAGPFWKTAPFGQQQIEYEITDLYKEWQSGTRDNYGIAIYSPQVGCNNAAVDLRAFSSDRTTPEERPYLRIVRTGDLTFRPLPGLNDGTDDGSEAAGKDTISHGSTPGTNYVAYNRVVGLPTSTCNPANVRGFIRFNLDTLPDGADVEQVLLGFTHTPDARACSSNCTADFYGYPVLDDWSETTLTHNAMPAVSGTPAFGPVTISMPNDLGAQEYDITQTYRDWKDGTLPNHGLAIYSPTVGCNNGAVEFSVYSSDHTVVGERPYLRIVAPTLGLTAVHPAVGPPAGGTSVTLTGLGFEAGATVDFGDVPATDVTVVDETTLAAIAPPHAGGTVAVTVTIPGGGTVTLGDAYTYANGDLVEQAFVAPAFAGPGDTFTVSEKVRNLGPDPLPATTVAFYLVPKGVGAPDADAPPPGAILVGTRSVGALAGRGISAAETSVTIPGGTLPGEYWLAAWADSGEIAAERSETNNTRTRPIKLGPDLFVSALRAPTAADAGAEIVIVDTTKNKGVSASDASVTRFYLSTDTTLEDGGDFLLGSRDVPQLARSASSRGETSVTLPGVVPGTYFILVVADDGDTVAELAEGNNLKAKRITIREGDRRPQRR